MSAHTLGPWTASAPDGSYHNIIRIFADADPGGSAPVAICPQREGIFLQVVGGQTDETTEAAFNARLIAAAPELLAMVRELDAWLAFRPDLTSREEHAKVKDLIAKATGEQP